MKTFIKVPERLIECLEFERGTMICRRCLYKEAMFRVWAIFYQYHRKNYNKLPLAFSPF